MENTVFKYIHLSLLAATIATPSFAQQQDEEILPRWYQIELVIFKHTQPQTSENLIRNPLTEENSSLYADIPALNPLLNKHSNGKDLPKPELDTSLQLIDTDTIVDTGGTSINDKQQAAPNESEIEPVEITFLPSNKEELILSEYALKLKNRRAYTVLWHGAWQQALESNGSINQYLISGGQLIKETIPDSESDNTANTNKPLPDIDSHSLNTENDATSDLMNPVGLERQAYLDAQQQVQQAPTTHRELQGSLTIYKKNFAHIEFDLWFTSIDELHAPIQIPFIVEQTPDISDEKQLIDTVSALDFTEKTLDKIDAIHEEAPLFELRYEPAFSPLRYGNIKEDRRLRPQELYYVDHPLFGAIVKMVEVPHPKKRNQQETTNQDQVSNP